jgi:hypothetical protein
MGYYEKLLTQLPLPEQERRKRRQRKRRIAFVAVLTVALAVGLAARAWAWHIGVSGRADCDATSVSVTVPDEPWATDASATGTISLAGQSKTWAKIGPGTATVSFPGVNGGTATVSGEFNTGEPANGTATIAAVADCEQEQQPPVTTNPPATTAPPVEEKQPPADNTDDEPKGSSVSKTRTVPLATHKAAPPKEATTATPSTPRLEKLPFTGPKEDMQRAMLLSGFALILAGVALVVTIRRKPAVATERWQLDRDSADTNLLATLFGRRSR